jgi:hypothetical protein
MMGYEAHPFGRSKLSSKLTPQFSFEKFTVLTVSKLGSKLNFYLVNFELNFEFKLEFKVEAQLLTQL